MLCGVRYVTTFLHRQRLFTNSLQACSSYVSEMFGDPDVVQLVPVVQ